MLIKRASASASASAGPNGNKITTSATEGGTATGSTNGPTSKTAPVTKPPVSKPVTAPVVAAPPNNPDPAPAAVDNDTKPDAKKDITSDVPIPSDSAVDTPAAVSPPVVDSPPVSSPPAAESIPSATPSKIPTDLPPATTPDQVASPSAPTSNLPIEQDINAKNAKAQDLSNAPSHSTGERILDAAPKQAYNSSSQKSEASFFTTHTGLIIGGMCGVAFLLLVLAVYLYYKRKEQLRSQSFLKMPSCYDESYHPKSAEIRSNGEEEMTQTLADSKYDSQSSKTEFDSKNTIPSTLSSYPQISVINSIQTSNCSASNLNYSNFSNFNNFPLTCDTNNRLSDGALTAKDLQSADIFRSKPHDLYFDDSHSYQALSVLHGKKTSGSGYSKISYL